MEEEEIISFINSFSNSNNVRALAEQRRRHRTAQHLIENNWNLDWDLNKQDKLWNVKKNRNTLNKEHNNVFAFLEASHTPQKFYRMQKIYYEWLTFWWATQIEPSSVSQKVSLSAHVSPLNHKVPEISLCVQLSDAEQHLFEITILVKNFPIVIISDFLPTPQWLKAEVVTPSFEFRRDLIITNASLSSH